MAWSTSRPHRIPDRGHRVGLVLHVCPVFEMNRRGFLKMLGLAPVAAPFVAAGIKAAPATYWATGGTVGCNNPASIMQFSSGIVGEGGPELAQLRLKIEIDNTAFAAKIKEARELAMGDVLQFAPRAKMIAKPTETPSVYDDAFWDARHTDSLVPFAKQGGPVVDLPCDTEPKGAA